MNRCPSFKGSFFIIILSWVVILAFLGRAAAGGACTLLCLHASPQPIDDSATGDTLGKVAELERRGKRKGM